MILLAHHYIQLLRSGVWEWTAVGFPLKNVERTNAYPGLNVNECQYLCEITQNCLYFVYNSVSKRCYLKYGLADEGGVFGPSGSLTGHKRSSSKFHKILLHYFFHYY